MPFYECYQSSNLFFCNACRFLFLSGDRIRQSGVIGVEEIKLPSVLHSFLYSVIRWCQTQKNAGVTN